MSSIVQKYINHLHKLVKPNTKYIYRGQSDAIWELSSTAKRRLDHSSILINKPNFDKYHRILISNAKSYKYHRKENLSDMELLAELQHLGAATGLMDFSMNFLIALWFASSSNTDQDGKVFLLDYENNNILEYKDEKLFDENSSLEDGEKHYFVKFDYKNNNRVFAQDGVFIFGYTEIGDLKEITIKASDKIEILVELKNMFNIDEERLFQDIFGFCSINDTSHKLDKINYKTQNSINYMEKGNEHYYKKEYKEAIESYKETIRDKVKNNDEAYHYMGLAYDKKEEYAKAIDVYKKAIEINPKNDTIYYNLGVAYTAEEKYDEAIDAYKKAIEINPENYDAHHNLGFIYTEQEKYDEAIGAYQKAIVINSKNDLVYYNMGLAYAVQEKYKKAIESYQKAIEINPENDEVYYRMGYSYHSLKKYQQAIEAYTNALKINQNNSEAYINLFELQLIENQSFDSELETKYIEVFENKKNTFIQYEMLKKLLSIAKGTEVDLEEWKKKYRGVSLPTWNFNELDKWIDGVEEKDVQKKLKEALLVFKGWE